MINVNNLFGGCNDPKLEIYYEHFQADSKLKAAALPPYISEFRIPQSYITKIKQQPLDNCWVYSATAMCETFALSQGYVATNTEDAAVLSETYMTYSEFDVDPTKPDYQNADGKQVVSTPATGNMGYAGCVYIDAAAFFMRGGTPAMECIDPLDPKTGTNHKLNARLRTITEQKPLNYYVTGFKILEVPKAPYPDKKFIDDVKLNILQYGPISMGFYFANDRANFIGNSMACCCEANHTVSPPNGGSHVVCIIGWDDNYKASNFNQDFLPKSNGAFLAKNSWGTWNGYDGYVWISYEDETMIGACCITDMDNGFYAKPQKVIDRARFGFMYPYYGANTQKVTFKCAYETTGDKDLLYGVGLACAAPCLADVTLTVGGHATALFQSVLLEYAGYVVKALPSPIQIGAKNTAYEISVTYTSINGIPVAVPMELKDNTYYTNINLKSGTCYIDGQDVTALAAADKKDYGNIALAVILQADSPTALNVQAGYENITVPQPSGGRIDGLCASYGLAPVEWRLEPYCVSSYNQTYNQTVKQYQITDTRGDVVAQGIVNTGSSAVSKLYLTAIIGEPDELVMRKTFVVSLDTLHSYAFTASSVVDDNKVDLRGTFYAPGATVSVSCNDRTQTTTVGTDGSWEIKSFALYNEANGWKDEYKNSNIEVKILDNQPTPVTLCSGSTAVTLSSPIQVTTNPKGGVIIAIIGTSAGVGIMAALACGGCCGSAACPVTIALGGTAYTVGSGFAKNQGYTLIEGSEAGTSCLELEDGPFDAVGGARNVNVKVDKVKVDAALENTDPVYYGGLAKEITKGGYVENCRIEGIIESSGKSHIGALFGIGEDVTVAGCKSSVQITGAASCGGVANTLSGKSSVTGCEVSGTLSAKGNAGGIAVNLQGGTISDCCVAADLNGEQVAGVAACMSGDAQVKNCYVSGRIAAAGGGQANGIAPGIDGNPGAVTRNVSVCSHISGDTPARVSVYPGVENVAYKGMHCDAGKTFVDDGISLKDWDAFTTAAPYADLGWDIANTWEFVEAQMFLRLKGSSLGYNYPFFIVAKTQNGKFQGKVGAELTLTGAKNPKMPEIKWTGITPQDGLETSTDAFWASADMFALTIPFIPVQVGNYNIMLSGTMSGDDYSIVLPLEVQE